MHGIKITPNLLEYQCTIGKFIRLPIRIESNRNFFARIGMLYQGGSFQEAGVRGGGQMSGRSR